MTTKTQHGAQVSCKNHYHPVIRTFTTSQSPDLPLPHDLAHGLRPWSQSPSEHRKHRNKGFSGPGAPSFGLGLADPAQGVGVDPFLLTTAGADASGCSTGKNQPRFSTQQFFRVTNIGHCPSDGVCMRGFHCVMQLRGFLVKPSSTPQHRFLGDHPGLVGAVCTWLHMLTTQVVKSASTVAPAVSTVLSYMTPNSGRLSPHDCSDPQLWMNSEHKGTEREASGSGVVVSLRNHLCVCICAPLCCKNMCCASRFCTDGRGAGFSRSKTLLEGHGANASAPGRSRSPSSAAPETRKPGQSAHAESTQGVFP